MTHYTSREEFISDYSEKAYIFDSICDVAISECFEDNTRDIESVQAYAENACDISLSREEAKEVLEACADWNQYNEKEGQNFYFNLLAKLS